MPRMLRRAAVLGATAHVASKRGEARGEAEAAQQQQAAAAQQQQPVYAPPPVAEAPPAPAPAGDSYEELMKLKSLFDAGVLTQDEFDAQKQKILAG